MAPTMSDKPECEHGYPHGGQGCAICGGGSFFSQWSAVIKRPRRELDGSADPVGTRATVDDIAARAWAEAEQVAQPPPASAEAVGPIQAEFLRAAVDALGPLLDEVGASQTFEHQGDGTLDPERRRIRALAGERDALRERAEAAEVQAARCRREREKTQRRQKAAEAAADRLREDVATLSVCHAAACHARDEARAVAAKVAGERDEASARARRWKATARIYRTRWHAAEAVSGARAERLDAALRELRGLADSLPRELDCHEDGDEPCGECTRCRMRAARERARSLLGAGEGGENV